MIIAGELGVPLRVTSGPAIQHAGDLAAILSSLTEGEVLFLDEIHRMARPAEEMLYLAMEDFRVDVIVGKGPGATAIPLELAPFTLVGATTRAGLLPSPLRDRFGFTAQLEFYEAHELERVLHRSAGAAGRGAHARGGGGDRRAVPGTPRIANRLLRRVRDYAQVEADGIVTREVATRALALYDVDHLGLDRLDRVRARRAVSAASVAVPSAVATLAVAVGEERGHGGGGRRAVPVRAGLLARTSRGRVATTAAWQHLGMAAPRDALGPPSLFADDEVSDSGT